MSNRSRTIFLSFFINLLALFIVSAASAEAISSSSADFDACEAYIEDALLELEILAEIEGEKSVTEIIMAGLKAVEPFPVQGQAADSTIIMLHHYFGWPGECQRRSPPWMTRNTGRFHNDKWVSGTRSSK